MPIADAIPDPRPQMSGQEVSAKILDRARLHTAMVQSLVSAPNGPPFDMARFLTEVAAGYLAIRDDLNQPRLAPGTDPG